MQGIQKQLYSQLERQRERTVAERSELESELNVVSRRKEQVGVELYGMQQQLARLQMTLENMHGQHNSIAEARLAEEKVLEECKARHAALKAAYAEKQKSLLKAQAELDTLTATTAQVAILLLCAILHVGLREHPNGIIRCTYKRAGGQIQ